MKKPDCEDMAYYLNSLLQVINEVICEVHSYSANILSLIYLSLPVWLRCFWYSTTKRSNLKNVCHDLNPIFVLLENIFA